MEFIRRNISEVLADLPKFARHTCRAITARSSIKRGTARSLSTLGGVRRRSASTSTTASLTPRWVNARRFDVWLRLSRADRRNHEDKTR